MRINNCDQINGLILIQGDRIFDDRGYFQEIYRSNNASYPHLIGTKRQVNMSVSKKDVVRGVHKSPFSKLVSCPAGSLFDIVVDLRKDSNTYLNVFTIVLNENSFNQVYVPANCGHGFMSLKDNTICLYYQDDVYDSSLEETYHWKDPKLNITWPKSDQYILSKKDSESPYIR